MLVTIKHMHNEKYMPLLSVDISQNLAWDGVNLQKQADFNQLFRALKSKAYQQS